jgi:hypothetical protein
MALRVPQLRVFANISKAEQKHMDTMLTMLNTYGIDDPVVSDDVGAFVDPALVALYDAIDETSQADIIAAYENLLAGSENHLRAFVGQIENLGVEYVAQVMDQSEVNAILGKPGTAAFEISAGLNDAWYYPETDGQGFFITVFPDRKLVFLAWFTFDTQQPAEDAEALLGGAGQRWLTAAGPYEGNQAVLESPRMH